MSTNQEYFTTSNRYLATCDIFAITHTNKISRGLKSSALLPFQVSEAKIAAIEEQYEAQMNEVENRYRSQATEKLYRLENRVKDLEKMLDISTLV